MALVAVLVALVAWSGTAAVQGRWWAPLPANPAAGAAGRAEGPRSRAFGLPWDGRLVRGVLFPEQSDVHFTWDPVRKRTPNRPWRRWGTGKLVTVVARVLGDFRAAHPDAPRVGVGDLSRPHGGEFGRRFGGRGHVSHQNGLDADVYYPRLDRLERRAPVPELVDRPLAQDLVDRFVAAGAVKVFVGPRLSLHGPPRVVQPLDHHEDHLHVRIRAPSSSRSPRLSSEP